MYTCTNIIWEENAMSGVDQFPGRPDDKGKTEGQSFKIEAEKRLRRHMKFFSRELPALLGPGWSQNLLTRISRELLALK